MSDCLNAVGFVFSKSKVGIKKDKACSYTNSPCQNCPTAPKLSPCACCANNSQYKICIFKLKKSHFVSSSLSISTSFDEAWENFKKSIIYQRNGNYVISLSTSCGKTHSFNANLVKAKICNCCDAVLVYFKYNIISIQPYSVPVSVPVPNSNLERAYKVVCANTASNICYWDLKSDDYYNLRFYNSSSYIYTPSLKQFGIQ